VLRHRVIPIVLLDGYSVLKTIQFRDRRNLGNPITVARIYNSRNIDELVLLDIDASKENRSIDLATVADIASECFMPLTVGGGLSDCDEIKAALDVGADKIVINTAALRDPGLIAESSSQFGSQCVVVSVDVRKENGAHRIFSHSKCDLTVGLLEWCVLAESLGAGELLVNSVDLDGRMEGYDLALVRTVSEAVGIPVIACGGASRPTDCVAAVQEGASAVGAASMFHFTDYTPDDCRRELNAAGIPAR
jgi:imidazole glycerol-phosphate synthase subunit HisF